MLDKETIKAKFNEIINPSLFATKIIIVFYLVVQIFTTGFSMTGDILRNLIIIPVIFFCVITFGLFMSALALDLKITTIDEQFQVRKEE